MEQLHQLQILHILRSIESRLDKIENILEINSKSAKKMDDHIEFIDNVYEIVRTPVSKFLTMCNGKTIELNKNLIKNETDL